MFKKSVWIGCLMVIVLAGSAVAQVPQMINFQGQLKDDVGQPVVDANYSIEFTVYDAAAGGTVEWGPQTHTATTQDGVFHVLLNDVNLDFSKPEYWLGMKVDGETLNPRRRLLSAPSAFWQVTGNAGTTSGTNFIGTTDNQAFEIKVNNMRALQIQPQADSPNLIGGYYGNEIVTSPTAVIGATISGGGTVDRVHRVTDDYGTVGGGLNNTVGDNNGVTTDKTCATVAGGVNNSAVGIYSTVGGGANNRATGESTAVNGGAENVAGNNEGTIQFALVSGGYRNTANGQSSTVGGGVDNTASSEHATVSGGLKNTASGRFSVVGGGLENQATNGSDTVSGGYRNHANGSTATVSGGRLNVASGIASVVPGGLMNTAAATYSLAAGFRAKANHNGTFVWADSTEADFASTAVNQFSVRANGGIRLVGNITGGAASNAASGINAFVGGGLDNTANGVYATVSGGYANTANGETATLSGGWNNTATGRLSTISGGWNNVADGKFAMVAGGIGNKATGVNSFAAGRNAHANHNGSFVWGDMTDVVVASTAVNQFTVRAAGGIRLLGTTSTNVLEITGGSDLSEQFDVQSSIPELSPSPGMVVSIDPDNPGALTVSKTAYDRRVAGIISGAGGVNPGMLMGQDGSVADGANPVALTGRVYVYVDAAYGVIEPGDLLTTSDTPGHAMKVTDYTLAQGAILGKAMTALTEGQGLVLVLVSLQ